MLRQPQSVILDGTILAIMNQFSIKDIENLTGIKAHTLRIWEQRYQLCIPQRKQSKHRFYDNEDLKHILRIAYLYHSGFKVSKIAAMQDAEVKEKALTIFTSNKHEAYINQLIEASIDYDQPRFEKLLHMLILRYGLEKCMVEVVYPFMNIRLDCFGLPIT